MQSNNRRVDSNGILIPFYCDDYQDWLIRVNQLEDIMKPNKNHAYITPDDKIYTLSYDGTEFVELTENEDSITIIKVNGIPINKEDRTVDIIVPLRVSELVNDNGFINNAVTNLLHYYDKSEIQGLLGQIQTMNVEVVNQLPEKDISTTTIYLVLNGREDINIYDEYLYVQGAWEKIGSTEIDLERYYTKEEINKLLDQKLEDVDDTKYYVRTLEGWKETLKVPTNGGSNGDFLVLNSSNELEYRNELTIAMAIEGTDETARTVSPSVIKMAVEAHTLVKKVNFIEPDSNGNIDLGEITESKLETQLQEKIENSITTVKVNGVPVDKEDKTVDIVVPIHTNELTNNSGFISNTVNNLMYYYNKEEINALLEQIKTISIEIVEELPREDISTTIIYLVPNGKENINIYDEYLYVQGEWEKIGSTEIDLEGYYTKEEIQELLEQKISDYVEERIDNGEFVGPMPNHRWEGTSLSFENPDGSYGKYVDLKGDTGVVENIIASTIQTSNNSTVQEELDTINSNLVTLPKMIRDMLYPIGIVIEFNSSTNPNLSIGGTWEKFGDGKVTVGLDTSQTEFNTLNKTGGSKTQSLRVEELPEHAHSFKERSFTYKWDGNAGDVHIANAVAHPGVSSDNRLYTYQFSFHETEDTGNGTAHNNLQPYIVVYRWVRTS